MGKRIFVTIVGPKGSKEAIANHGAAIQATAMIRNFNGIWIGEDRIRIPATGLELTAGELKLTAHCINMALDPLQPQDPSLFRESIRRIADELRIEPELFTKYIKLARQDEATEIGRTAAGQR